MRWESSREPERRACWAVAGGLALLTVLFTGAFPPFVNPNELSRLETVYAIVEQGTFRIDGALQALGDHEDKAVSGGHFYSNKAPGLALAGIPVYRILRLVLPAPDGGAAPIFSVVRFFTVSAVTLLALAMMLGTILLTLRVESSRFGMALRAIKQNEAAAEAAGINTLAWKLRAIVLSVWTPAENSMAA